VGHDLSTSPCVYFITFCGGLRAIVAAQVALLSKRKSPARLGETGDRRSAGCQTTGYYQFSARPGKGCMETRIIKLNVSFNDKDRLRHFGIKWNPVGKFWYFFRDNPTLNSLLPYCDNTFNDNPNLQSQGKNQTSKRFLEKTQRGLEQLHT